MTATAVLMKKVIHQSKKVERLEKQLQKKGEEIASMQKKLEQYYDFNQLLIKKAEATNQSTGNVVKDYEKQVIELKKALANSKPKSNVENIANSHAAQNVDYGKLDELKEEILLEKKRNVEVQQENEELNKLMNAFIQNKQKMEDMLKKKRRSDNISKTTAVCSPKVKS